jgi:hypothetical protein
MTISTTSRLAGPFSGNGSSTAFPFAFKVFSADDLLVEQVVDDAARILTLNSDYTVSLNSDQDANPGGTVILGTVLASGAVLTIVSAVTATQLSSILNLGGFYPKVIEAALDKLTILIQQIAEKTSRYLSLSAVTSTDVSAELPYPAKGEVIGWNAEATGLSNYSVGDLGIGASYAAWRAQTFNGDGSTLSFVLDHDAGSAENCDVSINGLSKIPEVDYTYDSATLTLTFTTAPVAGTKNVAVRYGQAVAVGTLADATVTTAMLAEDAVNTNIISGTLAFRNKIHNGKMEISQRGTSFSETITGSPTRTLDRWNYYCKTNIGTITVSQEADAPANNEFSYSLRARVTTADTSLSSLEYVQILQSIEGYNARDLIGRDLALSFWVRSSKAGTHCVSLRNGSMDRSYVLEYSVNAVDTWEKKTLTIPGGLITLGTWNWTNQIGVQLLFSLACGSAYLATAGSGWQANDLFATANQVNLLDTVGNIFAITGVQLEQASQPSPFEHRPFGVELMLCQRYYETQTVLIRSTANSVFGNWAVPKRGVPSSLGLTANSGSGATVASLATTGWYQSSAHSADVAGVLTADADI